MTISVVQTATSTGNPPVSFGSAITVGNSVVLVAPTYSTNGSQPSTSAVKIGGTTVTGTVALFNPGTNSGVNSTTGSGNVAYVSVWLIPNIQVSGQTAVDVTNSGSGIGQVAWEVAGLGTSPTLDQSSSGSSQSASTSDSGTPGAITGSPEFVVGASMIFAGSGASSPSGYTVSNPTGDLWAGYQIATSSGGTYHWTQTGAGQPWAAVVATILATPPVVQSVVVVTAAPYRPPPPPLRAPTQIITALPPAAPFILAEIVQPQGIPYLPPWQVTPQVLTGPAAPVNAPAGLASHAGTAQPPTIAITVDAGLASGAGAALNPSVTTSAGTNANAGLATATGAALAPSAAITVLAGLANGSGAPESPTISTLAGASAALATAAGAALAPSVTLAGVAQAGLAQAFAAALNASGAGVAPFTVGHLTAYDRKAGGPS